MPNYCVTRTCETSALKGRLFLVSCTFIKDEYCTRVAFIAVSDIVP